MSQPQRRRRAHKPLPRILFLDEAADRARSCASKDAYPSEQHARATMLTNGTAASLSVYECRYCGMWHLTSRRERKIENE